MTFEFDGGKLPDGTVNRKTVTVDKGHPVANPGEPSYTSRLFMYWYLDDMNAGPDKMYDFSSQYSISARYVRGRRQRIRRGGW